MGIAGDDAIVFMGLIKDLFFEVYDLMPKKRDYDFEDFIRNLSMEEEATRFPKKLIPSEYFVQNVVDLQDLLGLRHCVFAIGLSGNNKSNVWKMLSKAWTRGVGNNPAGIGKTVWKDINPKSITPNELYGFINIATREWKAVCSQWSCATTRTRPTPTPSGSSSMGTSTPTGLRT